MAHRYEHTYYNQGDSAWGSLLYSPHMTYAAGGCGPTSVAMAVSGVAGNGKITPVDVGKYIASIGGVTDGQGTNWNAIPQACAKFGVKCTQLSTSSEYGVSGLTTARKKFLDCITDERYAGIELHGPGYFTNGGHYTFCRDGKADYSLETFDVAYPPRNGYHGYFTIATSANAPGAAQLGKPFHDWTTKIFYLIDYGAKPATGTVKFKLRQISRITGVYFNQETVVLQRILKGRGYKIDVDGYFGPLTAEVVEKFQKKHNLSVDGVVGPKTWEKLFGVSGSVSGSYFTITFEQKHFTKVGSDPDKYVKILQWMLKGTLVKNEKTGKMEPLYSDEVDGWYGNNTTKAVWAYQKLCKLNTDGIAGPKTLSDMFDSLAA